jgi:hypothetical protein
VRNLKNDDGYKTFLSKQKTNVFWSQIVTSFSTKKNREVYIFGNMLHKYSIPYKFSMGLHTTFLFKNSFEKKLHSLYLVYSLAVLGLHPCNS